MKKLVLLLVAAAALSTSGQVAPQSAKSAGLIDLERSTGSQRGCPVEIVAASFENPARLMLAGSEDGEADPKLHLEYRDLTGKEIESLVFTGWIKVKESRYQLDSTTHPFELRLSPRALQNPGQKAFQLAGNAIGFDRIELAMVSYTDGTSWKAGQQNCVYRAQGESLQVAR